MRSSKRKKKIPPTQAPFPGEAPGGQAPLKQRNERGVEGQGIQGLRGSPGGAGHSLTQGTTEARKRETGRYSDVLVQTERSTVLWKSLGNEFMIEKEASPKPYGTKYLPLNHPISHSPPPVVVVLGGNSLRSQDSVGVSRKTTESTALSPYPEGN